MKHEKQIEELKNLKKMCELGILILESGYIIEDPSITTSPYDFKLGNYGITKLDKIDDHTKL